MSNRPRRAVRDIIKYVQNDESDFDEQDSSNDEYLPTKSDEENISDSISEDESSSDNEPLVVFVKNKKLTKGLKRKKGEKSKHSKRKQKQKRRSKSPLKEKNQNVEDSDDSSDELPLSNLKNADKCIADDPDLQDALVNIEQSWETKEFDTSNIDSAFKGETEEPPADANIDTPYNYFRNMITDEMLRQLEYQTNLYVLQKDGVELNTTKKEIEVMIGIYIRMGLVSMPRVRSYCESFSRYPSIADKMSRNRFEKLASSLHVRDNLSATDQEKEDKLWKIRPWLSALRTQFLTIPAEEFNSVDEIMVPFKGRSGLKQYIRGKPNPWGV